MWSPARRGSRRSLAPPSSRRTASSRRSSLAVGCWFPSDDRDGVADRDRPRADDVGVEAAPVEKVVDDPRPREPLEVEAGLADLDALAFDLTHEEPPADQVVETNAACDDLPSRLRPAQADV